MFKWIARKAGELVEFRMIYVFWRPPFYGKIGIAKDANRRVDEIDIAVKGKVIKIIALPFILAPFWERLLLFSTALFQRCPPTRRGRRSQAGRTEWRFLPGCCILFPILVIYTWLIQLHLIVWVITYAYDQEPFSVLSRVHPWILFLWEILKTNSIELWKTMLNNLPSKQ